MGKKKQVLVSESDPDIDLKFPIHQHSLICDKLIKLVPAKFYLPTDEKEKPRRSLLQQPLKTMTSQSGMKNSGNDFIVKLKISTRYSISERSKERREKKAVLQKKCKRESGSEEKKPGTSTSSESVGKDAEEATHELKFSHVRRRRRRRSHPFR
ncbi:hypothetical protein OIU76_014216 [Salix suchowensis]|nr:hypothetical protein OIU76_014216 [Salix suchowensis]